ncbi:MAG: hypothetical protein ACYC61_16905 [Isosphaeraceae bacterium]
MIRVPKVVYKPPCDTSWVGECPWTHTRCFGAEDGRFILESSGSQGLGEGNVVSVVFTPTVSYTIASDTINAIAFSGDLFAASSRNEVVVGRRTGPGVAGLVGYSHPFVGGAHGVLASRPGVFLAPIADQGLLILEVAGENVGARISSPPEAPFNFYRLARLGNAGNNDAFVAAGRRDGLLALELDDESYPRSAIHHRFEGHDIVDVCSLSNPSFPFAAACVSRDCVLFLSRNVLEKETPLAVSLGDLRDTAYTLLSAGGHLFLLTDRRLIDIPRLASRFLDGERPGPELEIGIVRVDAAEAFLLRDQAILLLEETSVSEFRIAELVGIGAGDHPQEGAVSNGPIRGGSRTEVPCEVQRLAVSPVESGWQLSSAGALVTNPAA